jgi:hypothetical protein
VSEGGVAETWGPTKLSPWLEGMLSPSCSSSGSTGMRKIGRGLKLLLVTRPAFLKGVEALNT